MIEQEEDSGITTVLCDDCDDEVTVGGIDGSGPCLPLSEVHAAIKGMGWTASMVDGEWEHRCPGCSDRDMYL